VVQQVKLKKDGTTSQMESKTVYAEALHVVPVARHNSTLAAAYRKRGYAADEIQSAVRVAENASRHGIRTHNGIKALSLDDHFGSKTGGCVPGAAIEKRLSRFPASEVWNANKKLGQAVAEQALESCIALAERFGIGQVSVDNAFHYLWGGGYVMEAARRGYVAYTNCTSAKTGVAPFGGRRPALGTNPHSWGFPTTAAVGFPIVVDWATSVISLGRVQQLGREGKMLPPDVAIDKDGNMTTVPANVKALLPFGQHKGYGLAVIDELMAALIGGSLPTLRGETAVAGEKQTPCFYFQVVHPEALSSGAFAGGRSQDENIKAVINDILADGNEHCLLPGQPEATWATRCGRNGGLLFSAGEIAQFNQIATDCGQAGWAIDDFPLATD
jgi:L-2-hydroxycarboxylate dehydrogenase (NAD+)